MEKILTEKELLIRLHLYYCIVRMGIFLKEDLNNAE